MIIEIPNENSIVKWKNDEKDEWKVAEISDLIKAYESPKVTVFAENASKEEIADFKHELENVLERPKGEIKKYKPLELDYNVQCAVENLRTAYWSNEPEKVAKDFTEAEDIIISSICHHGYTVCKRPQGEWIYGEDDCGQDGWFCSECGFFVPWYYQYYEKDINFIRDYKACPHCLAEMITYTGKDRDTKGGKEE